MRLTWLCFFVPAPPFQTFLLSESLSGLSELSELSQLSESTKKLSELSESTIKSSISTVYSNYATLYCLLMRYTGNLSCHILLCRTCVCLRHIVHSNHSIRIRHNSVIVTRQALRHEHLGCSNGALAPPPVTPDLWGFSVKLTQSPVRPTATL